MFTVILLKDVIFYTVNILHVYNSYKMVTFATEKQIVISFFQSNGEDVQDTVHQLEMRARAIIEEVRSRVAVLANNLMNNASVTATEAEGKTSQLVLGMYNDIQRGIADARQCAVDLAEQFHTNFSIRVAHVYNTASNITQQTENAIKNATSSFEKTVIDLLNEVHTKITEEIKRVRNEIKQLLNSEDRQTESENLSTFQSITTKNT